MEFLKIVLSAAVCLIAFAAADLVEDENVSRVDNKHIINHGIEFGERIFQNTNGELRRYAERGLLRAKLTRSSSDISKCVQNREREALEDVKKYYNQKFLDQITKLRFAEVEDQQNYEHDYATRKDMTHHDLEPLQRTRTLFPGMERAQIDLVKTVNQLVEQLIQYTETRAEEALVAISKCFPEPYP